MVQNILKFRLSFLSTIIFLSMGSLASADLTYEFGQSSYQVPMGDSFGVEVYLAQVGSTVNDPVDLTIDGLFSGGVRVFFNDNPPTDGAAVLSAADIVPNPLFDDTFVGETIDLVPGESAGFADAIDDFNAPLLGNRILLGTIQFTAGDIVGEVTNLRAERFDPLFENTIANDINATALDDIIFSGFATITVTGVPEHSAFALTVMMTLSLCVCRRRSMA